MTWRAAQFGAFRALTGYEGKIAKTGVVSKLREYEKQLIFADGTEILINEIFSIERKQFNSVQPQ